MCFRRWLVLTKATGSNDRITAPRANPRFNQPNGVAVDGASNLYVADALNNCIRMITPAGTVTTLAGSINGYSGSADGTNTSAEFNNPTGLCLNAATNIYVADYDNSTVRKITPTNNGDWVTTTIAGQAEVTGTNTAPTPSFGVPTRWLWTAQRICM